MESEARVTAKVAWRVDTTRLQKSKERLGNILLTITNADVHETTPTTIVFVTYFSIFSTLQNMYMQFKFQQMCIVITKIDINKCTIHTHICIIWFRFQTFCNYDSVSDINLRGPKET